jgi:hypothetical protein
MKEFKLEYGMKLRVKAQPVKYIPQLGIAVTTSDSKTVPVVMEVSKYWDSDKDANRYKVKLIPASDEDKKMFGNETFYSCDLHSLIDDGRIEVVK